MPQQIRTLDEFRELLASTNDNLSLVVKSHYAIEGKLHELLDEQLPHSDRMELHRVTFLLKVDFLIAMGVIYNRFRHLFELVNSVRNRFAHDPYSSYSEDDATKVKNAVRSIDKNYPLNGDATAILKVLFHVVFDYSARRHERVVIGKLRDEALHEMMEDRSWQPPHPSGIELPPITDEDLKSVHDEMEPEIKRRVGEKLSTAYPHIKPKE